MLLLGLFIYVSSLKQLFLHFFRSLQARRCILKTRPSLQRYFRFSIVLLFSFFSRVPKKDRCLTICWEIKSVLFLPLKLISKLVFLLLRSTFWMVYFCRALVTVRKSSLIRLLEPLTSHPHDRHGELVVDGLLLGGGLQMQEDQRHSWGEKKWTQGKKKGIRKKGQLPNREGQWRECLIGRKEEGMYYVTELDKIVPKRCPPTFERK